MKSKEARDGRRLIARDVGYSITVAQLVLDVVRQLVTPVVIGRVDLLDGGYVLGGWGIVVNR